MRTAFDFGDHRPELCQKRWHLTWAKRQSAIGGSTCRRIPAFDDVQTTHAVSQSIPVLGKRSRRLDLTTIRTQNIGLQSNNNFRFGQIQFLNSWFAKDFRRSNAHCVTGRAVVASKRCFGILLFQFTEHADDRWRRSWLHQHSHLFTGASGGHQIGANRLELVPLNLITTLRALLEQKTVFATRTIWIIQA